MKKEKMTFKNIKGVLNRDEMKSIIADIVMKQAEWFADSIA